MPQYDMPLDQLRRHRGHVVEPSDFDAFWQLSLSDAADASWPSRLRQVDNGLTVVETYDVTFAGFGGHPIRGWFHRPIGVAQPPILIRYPGYTGGRGLPHQAGLWPSAGVAVLNIDARGQGSGGFWRSDTADPSWSPNPSLPGFMTRGLLDREEYYYRRVIIDSVRAVEVARTLPHVDPERVGVIGTSQGGGLALIVAGLAQKLWAVIADVPFLCDIVASTLKASDVHYPSPYTELVRYLQTNPDHEPAAALTLSYVDAALHARRATAPALFSVALMDTICPPSGVFAAVNAYRGPSRLEVYPYGDHEGGACHQEALQLRWLRDLSA